MQNNLSQGRKNKQKKTIEQTNPLKTQAAPVFQELRPATALLVRPVKLSSHWDARQVTETPTPTQREERESTHHSGKMQFYTLLVSTGPETTYETCIKKACY